MVRVTGEVNHETSVILWPAFRSLAIFHKYMGQLAHNSVNMFE
jgi:hypothetical protein